MAMLGLQLLCKGFLQLQQLGATLHCGPRASHRSGFSCCGTQALGTQASVAAVCGLYRAGLFAYRLICSPECGLFPGQGSNPSMYAALAGRFLTVRLPRKSSPHISFYFHRIKNSENQYILVSAYNDLVKACDVSSICMFVLVLSVVSNSLRPHRLQPARLLCPWNSSGKNTGVYCHSLLQRNFPTQGSSLPPALQADSLSFELQGSPIVLYVCRQM